MTASITGNTALTCLIGSPVAHSVSPLMHNSSYRQLGVDATYLAFDVSLNDLNSIVPALHKLGVVGYNVTMPHKAAVIPYLDELSDAARLMGAVNTVKIKNGRSYGYNTDGEGFFRNLEFQGGSVAGKRVVVMGAGGAGSAIFVQAALEKAKHIDVFNSRSLRFEQACERACKTMQLSAVPIEVHDINDKDALKSSCLAADIIINATSVGMAPYCDESLIDETFMPAHAWIADAVYNPRETKLLACARKHGNPLLPGLGMIVWQGALAEKIWFDVDMDIAYINAILEQHC